MPDGKKKYPACFGILESVFPKGADGFRKTPEDCFECPHRTECLKTAVSGSNGLKIKEEFLERAYESGRIGFFERWYKKKSFQKKIQKKKKGADNESN